MSKKRAASALAILMLLAGLVSGCGGNNNAGNTNDNTSPATSGTDTSGTADKKNVTITLSAASDWIKPVDNEIIEDFTKETGIKVDVQVIPADQYASVLKAKLASGEGPDLSIIWAEANAAQFQPQDNFIDLSSEEWVGRMTEAAKKNSTYNGQVIGWGPEGENAGWGLMYNKNIFEQYNLQVPKTYAEFTAISDTLLGNGITPVYEPLKDSWHSGIWFALLGPAGENASAGLYQNLNNNKATFDAVAPFVTFLDQYKEAYDKGYFGKDALSNTYDKHMVSMESGKYAMTMVPANEDVQSKAKGETYDFSKYGMFPAPFADNQSLAVYDGSLIRVVNKNSKNIDAAKEYLSYISRADVLKKFYDATGLNPAFTDLPQKQDEIEKSLRANSDGTVNTIMETGIKYWDNTVIGNYVVEMLLDGKSSLDVLKAVDKDRLKLFSASE
ncbi:ABC transporter substrate-binding protein [Paenibacillus pedocola]|uniref:ABC transporter substrate-binding protein n=1 Tax=Paenibacillus pedocola TaxID=3242193 RepID=UPI0028773F84|nr:extracellular solute-binding protein [Paenibacillus typhae]